MKRIAIVLMLCLPVVSCSVSQKAINAEVQEVKARQKANVEEQKVLVKTHKELAKLSKQQLNELASRIARKEARRYKKEGWTVNIGSLPLDKQLDKSFLMQYEFGTDGKPKYIMSEGSSLGATYEAARMQATELAKINLAGQVQTEVSALIETTLQNSQISQKEADSITESLMTSKNLIAVKLGRTLLVIECYRDVKEKRKVINKEVKVQLAYDYLEAAKAAKEAMAQELQAKGQDLDGQLQKVFGF